MVAILSDISEEETNWIRFCQQKTVAWGLKTALLTTSVTGLVKHTTDVW